MTAHATVYVSATGDERIDMFRLDPLTGALSAEKSFAAGPMVMPLALSPDRRRLYAAVRAKPFRILSFAIEAATGTLTPLGEAPLPASMASIATDRSGRYLFAASYGDSMVSVSRMDAAGTVAGVPVQVLATGRHAHAIGTDHSNRTVYVPCLGSDDLFAATFDSVTGRLEPQASLGAALAAGDGPRHFRVSADNRFLYVLCELSGDVVQFARDASTASLIQIGRASAVPVAAGLARGQVSAPITAGVVPAVAAEPRIWAADLHLTPDGRFLYASERTSSTLALFHVDQSTGALTYGGSTPTETQPRGFAIDPTGQCLISAGEKSDHIAAYRIDAVTGALTLASRAPVGAGACWVEIVPRG